MLVVATMEEKGVHLQIEDLSRLQVIAYRSRMNGEIQVLAKG